MSQKKNVKRTSKKEVRKARFKLVWSVVAVLYFISTPKTTMAVIWNLIPLVAEVYEEFDEGSLAYKIFASVVVLGVVILIAAALKLIPTFGWFKFFVALTVINCIFSQIRAKK